MFIIRKIWNQIQKSNNILLTLHPSPDADSVGGNLAFYHFLKAIGKKVSLISGDSEFPLNLKSLPGSSQVLPQNFSQINLNNYDLCIFIDISSKNQISKLKEISLPKQLKTIVIDHHVTNSKFANINLINTKAPAACQVIYDFFKSKKIKITKSIAICLFIGLYADTGGFKYPGTTTKTFSIAAELTKIYPQFHQIIFELENNDHPDRLKFLSLMLNSVNTFISGKVAIASVDYQTIKDNNLDPQVIGGSDIANLIKSITGWEIGVSLIEYQPKTVKASFRTRDYHKYDLSKIATNLNGGGHKSAAGVTLFNISLKDAEKLIVDKLTKVYKLN